MMTYSYFLKQVFVKRNLSDKINLTKTCFLYTDPLSSRLFFNENGSSCLPIRYVHKVIPGHCDNAESYLTLALEVALIGKCKKGFDFMNSYFYGGGASKMHVIRIP